MLMKIFLSCSHPSPDMALRLIHIQHLTRLPRQGGVDLKKSFGDILMYRTLTDPEPFRRLPHSRVILYDIISNLHGSFLNVIFQKNPPANIVFTMYAGEKKVMLISRYFSTSISACILFSVSHLPRTQPGRPRSHPSQHCTDFPAIPCAVNPCTVRYSLRRNP